MRQMVSAALVLLMSAGTAWAAISTAETKRLQEASQVVREMRDMPDKGVPDDLWNRADCVLVIPSMKKAALGIGGEYGRGVMSCRTSKEGATKEGASGS